VRRVGAIVSDERGEGDGLSWTRNTWEDVL